MFHVKFIVKTCTLTTNYDCLSFTCILYHHRLNLYREISYFIITSDGKNSLPPGTELNRIRSKEDKHYNIRVYLCKI